jgi:hypothetical protein
MASSSEKARRAAAQGDGPAVTTYDYASDVLLR